MEVGASRGPLRVLFVVAVVGSLLALPQDAWAFWRQETCGNQARIDYAFSNDSEWSSDFKTEVNRAFDQWTSPAVLKDIDGTAMYTRGGSVGYTVRWDDLGTKFAQVVCGGFNVHNIEFNRNRIEEYRAGALDLQGIATHEFGHAFGLSHSGTTGTSVPTMGTCNSQLETPESRTLELDDVAAATFRTDVVNNWGTGNANPSFEHGKRYWTQRADWGIFRIRGDGGASGPRYARFTGSISQEVEVVEGWNFARRLSIRHRRPAGGYDYFVVFRYVRWIDYVDTSSNRCGWPKDANGTRQNLSHVDDQLAGWWSDGFSTTCYPTSSWSTCTTAFTGDINSISGPDGRGVRIDVDNRSCCAPVDIDLARIQMRWPPE